ncbi:MULTISPECIES: hypothetical protein [Aeromonas]|uniref:hypothetical protein n=1 Tax=Aeromonas TaxID=642 RepID=UPI0006462B1A|nr:MULTISPECIES: hypothetical protein [Aeromonas]TNH70504.1 hypothetical protein CF105_13825 [Aeromonas veronii]
MKIQQLYEQIYRELLKVYPEKPWLKIMSKMSADKNIAINKYGERIIAYGLYLWESKRFHRCDQYEKNAIAEAFFYSAKFLELYVKMSASEQGILKPRFGSAIKESEDMRALIFEVFTNHYLVKLGYSVENMDMSGSGDTYDYLVRKNGHEVQVECKSFSYDKGLNISADEAQKLSALILERGLNPKQPTKNAVTFVTVGLLVEFPEEKCEQDLLLDEIFHCLEDKCFCSDKITLYTETFEHVENIDENECWEKLKNNGDEIELAFSISEPVGENSRVALSITANLKKSLLREFENKCKDVTKRQFKVDRPGVIFVHISHIDTYRALKSSKQFENKIKNIFSQSHIYGLLLVSNIGALTQKDYPFFYIAPCLKFYKNEASTFNNIALSFKNG